MPLLRKKEFQKTTIPELLRDDEEVFHCEVTNEIFRDYDEFCQRIILVNSMVWSCAMTGKTNLTYAEALQNEKTARKNLKDFPMELRIPVLFIASKTKRSAFGDMAEDVFSFVKDRFFVGEIVESSFTENNWQESHVLQVIAPTEEQLEAYSKSNQSKSNDNHFLPPASLFRYEVEQLDANDQDSSQVMMLEASHVRRKKGPYTKERNRLFLKQFVELNYQGLVVIKESAIRKYKLNTIKFNQIFDGPLPDFEQSKKAHKAVNGKKMRQETFSKYLDKSNHASTNGQSLLEEMKRKELEYKQKIIEMKQKKLEEKILEKQKRKEENLKMSSYVKEWYKPRDDLELEDQKVLPTPTPVQTKIPAKYFGDALMIIEFVNSFSTILSAKDFFAGGLTLDLLERALTEKEVAGPLTDLVQMLLSALFNVQEEETTENRKSEIEINTDETTESMTLSEASRLATLALNWSKVYQGVPLSRLPLYPLTISEVLRLHLLSSGARLSETATKWRYQQRGGYLSEDDPGLALRIKQPHILKALSVHNINELSIGDKVAILTCLIDQLLTYADVRDMIEERLEKSKQLKAELKSLQALDKKYEQEFISARLKIKRENKGNEEQIQKELKKVETDSEQKRNNLEHRIKEILNSLSDFQIVLGTDRAYQKYVKLNSLPGFFVESDERNPGVCLDKITVQNPELIDAAPADTLAYVKKMYEECNGSDKENEHGIKRTKKMNGAKNSSKTEPDLSTIKNLLMCTANKATCPVHREEISPQWGFYHQTEDIQNLISSLNKRGIRENELRQNLETDLQIIENIISNTNPSKLNSSLLEDPSRITSKKVQNTKNKYEDSNLGFPLETEVAEVLNLSLIDSILEIEEKIFDGNLGSLKVKDRDLWRKNLNDRNFVDLDKTLIKKEDALEKLKNEDKGSRPGTPDSIHKDPGKYLGSSLEISEHFSENDSEESLHEQLVAVKSLATALLQVAQAVEPKYLKKPLGHATERKDKDSRKDRVDVLEKWEQSLLCSSSYSQIFLHYCTLDNCIMWGRSVLKARCRICHRLSDPENMLLCDSCNKGHHLYCLKPKLTTVPEGDWFCNKCKPVPTRSSTRETRKTRKLFTEESEEEEENSEENETEPETTNGDISILEVCEECGSGGHVICCDFCPKVYHLECTQPALRRIPRGEWKCHKCRQKNDKHNNSVEHPCENGNNSVTSSEAEGSVDQGFVPSIPRRCATKARHKIHGFIRSLRRKSVDSGSSEETPQRRSTRRVHDKGEEDDLPLHNAALQELLSDVMRHKDSWPFTRPVTKHEVPDYYEVITKPMDFGKIKYKLNMGEYKCDEEVMADSALVFENCDTYNNSEALVYKCGYRLLKFFEKRAKNLGLKFPSGLMGSVDSGSSDCDSDNDGSPQPKKMKCK